MFTGLIEEIGIVKDLIKGQKSVQIIIGSKKIMMGLKIGDSVSTNGVCLTVVQIKNNEFAIDVMPETLSKSNLGILIKGDPVNLERALRLGDRFGGHMVSGHVDGVGTIIGKVEDDNATRITIEAQKEILKYVIKKGSIALDGISLTVVDVGDTKLEISMIPLTKKETTLLAKPIGAKVNIECDMVGKYIERLSNFNIQDEVPKKIDMDFLKLNGFA